jgi:hypothetical protein
LAYSSALMIEATYSSKPRFTFSGLHDLLSQKIELFITNIARNSNPTSNKKFWEELIAYFPFTVILVSDTASREKTLVCTQYAVKRNNLGGCNVGITDGTTYKAHRLDGFRWHDIHTKFHKDLFGHSGNIKVITSIILEFVGWNY